MRKRHVDSLKTLYRRMPPGLRGRIPPALLRWLGVRLMPEMARRPPGDVVEELEARLWGGFSAKALEEFAVLRAAPPSAACAAEAALALARWHAVQGDLPAALAAAVEAREALPRLARDRRQVLLETLFLCRLGRGAEARDRLDALGPRFDVTARLMRANSWNPVSGAADADGARALAEVNGVFRQFGLAEIALRRPGARLGLDTIGPASPLPGRDGPMVTVIVPVWNAAATLATALTSLAEQTHASLEILVVDDASHDASADIASDFAARDPRIRLIRQAENRGGYAARNRALAEATGEFVTVQDADDWSHPERIARHLADLARGERPFNISDWVRASPELGFWGTWRPSPNHPTRNFSSVFCARATIERIGPWDSTRISADREFINRAQRLYRLPRQMAFLPGAPLAFGRSDEGSLTRTSATHAATMYHGLRREYHEAMDFWHARLDPASIRAPMPAGGQPARPPYFPAPLAIRSERGPAPAHDLLFIGDFNFQGGTQKSALHMIGAARAAGLSVALLQYPRYDRDVTAPLAEEVRAAAWAMDLRILAPGEAAQAETVVVTYPAVLDQLMDRFPRITHRHLAVVVNQMAERDLARADIAYDPARARANLVALFGSEGHWVPISERVRALMAADPRYPAPWHETWTPLMDGQSLGPPRRWRGGDRGGAQPVIGRHGRDHALKWPRDPEALARAYCAGQPCEVRFLGGAFKARARLRHWPRNWRDEPFGALPVADFLAGLDVFLHFPDPDYIEEFGRAPMEAMAAGLPVILPPEFAPTFGAAALYAAPEEVWPLVERLWRDETFWQVRASAGRAFVAAHCDYKAFPGRVARLAAAP